ncbi:MAG: CzcE family metal-binding protein [Burkholderiales bacterium]|nr:CzcE family metal-binding protein [Burkholderiales bacterium]
MLRKFSILLAAGALSATLGTSAFAVSDQIKVQPLGSAASAQSVDRQIELRPGAKYVNVTRGETVLIKAGGQAFAWKFDTLGAPVFSLQEIAPKDINVQGVKVYVNPSSYDVQG